MANNKIQYALEKGTELRTSSKNLLGIPTGEKRVYTIEKPLGQGGFGITYLATRKIGNIDQVFAIKEFFVKGQCWREEGNPRMMFPEAVEAKQDVKEWLHEFENEAELLNQTCKQTPNIVQVNEVFRANDTAYYVMEYLEGGSLRDVVKQQGALQEKVALSYILPVVKAVHMLHTMKQPLLHCDIKHDNIMLRKHVDGVIEPVLIDFGESRHFNEKGDLTTTHTTAGCSRGFAPMEQYLGVTTFIPQVDVYALAATMYYAVTGDEPPFADDVTETRVLGKLPIGLSDSLKKAIVHGMQKDKDQRTRDTRTLYKEVSGIDIEESEQTTTIVSPELPIGYSLKNREKRYEIVSVVCQESFYIQYKVICTWFVDEERPLHKTTPIKYDIYEFFDKKNSHRQDNKSVITDGNTDASHKQFVNLCKKITKSKINGIFREDSNPGWATFIANNTFYLVDTHYRRPLPWKRILSYGGLGLCGTLLVIGTINIYDGIQNEKWEMSQRLTNAIITNNADSLRVFAEDYDSARAYLPYALICYSNGDFDIAERFANDSLRAIIKQKRDSIAQVVLSKAQEQHFDSLLNTADKHYKNGQYYAAKKTIAQMDGEYLSRLDVQLLLSKIETAIAEDETEVRFDSLYNAAQTQYNCKQFKIAKETIAKMDREHIARQKVKDLLNAIEKAITPTDDELYQKALKEKDWPAIEKLANKGYSKAYYQLAQRYFSKKSYSSAKKWANKAVNAKVDVSNATKLINRIDMIVQTEDAYNKAEKYYSEKKWEKALGYAKYAIKINSLSPESNNRLREIITQCEKWNPPVWNPTEYSKQ